MMDYFGLRSGGSSLNKLTGSKCAKKSKENMVYFPKRDGDQSIDIGHMRHIGFHILYQV